MKAEPRRDYLDVANIDDLARMLTALMQESWVMRDRMAVIEQLLEERVGITAADIDDFVGTPAARAETAAMRDRFIGKVAGAPLAARERGVDQILARAGMAREGALA